jgi:hypothetical protein
MQAKFRQTDQPLGGRPELLLAASERGSCPYRATASPSAAIFFWWADTNPSDRIYPALEGERVQFAARYILACSAPSCTRCAKLMSGH